MNNQNTPKTAQKLPGLVPTLRFPEFKDAGEWDDKKFGELCQFVRGPFGGALKKDIFVSDGYAVYEQSHAIYGNFDSFRYFITEKKYEELSRFSVKSGDIIMSCSGTMGKFAIIPDNYWDGVINQALLKLSVKARYNLEFVKYTLELPANQEKLLSQSAGGAIKNVVGVGLMKEIKLPMPNLEEQQKIAECLASLDELMGAHSQKLEALKTHKKGLMQNLFPAQGQTTPQYRFPEFKNAGEWEEKSFKEIAKFLSGGTPSKDVPEYWEGTIPWISASSMHSTKIEKSDSNITLLAVSDGARIVDKGTLLLLVRGSMLHKRIPIGITETTASFNQDVKAIVLKEDVSERYLMSFLIASESKLLGAVTATGIGAGKLDTNDLNDLLIKFPSLSEQQKIADCLSSLDDLITAQTQKIDALKQHKKGLMQQLFPVVES